MKDFGDVVLHGLGGIEEKNIGFISIDRSSRGDTEVIQDVDNTMGFLENRGAHH